MATNSAINTNSPIGVTKGGVGAATFTDHGVLVGSGTGAVTALTVGTDGQVLLGDSANDPVFATLASAGGTVTFTPGAGTLNLEAAGGGLDWSEETANAKTIVNDEGYISNDGADLIVFTLPATAAVGTEWAITGKGTGLWEVDQSADQYINLGADTTTVGTGGKLESTATFDCIEVVCTVADLGWTVRNYVGTITVT